VHVVFWEEGALGIDFKWPVVEAIQPDTPAADARPLLRVGLELVAVQGQQVGADMKCGGRIFHAASRPVRLTFTLPSAQQVSAGEPKPESTS
jgi:hypothetical protein